MSEASKFFIEKIDIEEDMGVSAIRETDGFTKRIFKKSPLIGDYVIGEKNLDTLYANVKKYIDMRMDSDNARVTKNSFNVNVHEQTALAVVNYAKEWNSNEEGKFTRFVAMQFGYKDDYWRVWNIITESLEIALNANHKFFIRRNDDRQFYETVMSHSMGPKGSWIPLIDLLFSFYKENLDWKYVPNDPLFVRFVYALQRHFNNESADEDNFLIASRSYSLKVGIRRLVQERPGYCVKLFEDIVRRLDELLQNKAEPSKRYVYAILDQWYKSMLSNVNSVSEPPSSRENRRRNTEVALSYSEVTVKYTLIDDEVYINIPAIRLLGEETGEARALLYLGDSLVDEISLEIVGNELGETICGISYKLPLEKVTSEDVKLRVSIMRGNDLVYDSAKKLWRSVILFLYGNEVNINRINYSDYQLFAINKSEISGSNIEFNETESSNLLDVYFDEGYKLKYCGKTLVMDASAVKGISVSEPQCVDGVTFEIDGEEMLVASEQPELCLYLEDETDIKKYSVAINGKAVVGTDYWNKEAKRYEFCSNVTSEETVRFVVKDLSSGKSIFDNAYLFVDGFNYAFNQDCFVTTQELEQGEIRISLAEGEVSERLNGNDAHKRELAGGILIFDIPFINCCIQNLDQVYFDRYIRYEELDANTILHIENNTGKRIGVSIGDYYLESFDRDLLLNDVKELFNPYEETIVDLNIEIDSVHRTIFQIVYANMFVDAPVMGVNENVFWWDGGLTYVGDSAAKLSISLENENKYYEFPLVLGERSINVFADDEFEDGDYEWAILEDESIICRGVLFLGDERKARFKDKVIRISRIAGEIDDRTSEVNIKDVYIDQIKFVETTYVETEEDIFDVYTGCMYWNRYDGKKYYSFKYTDKKYKVNPVKIIYISKKYLRIVNVDDEGIYCFNNRFSANPGIEITDYEPTRNSKDYNDILFYLYSVESLKKEGTSEHAIGSVKEVDVPKTTDVPKTGRVIVVHNQTLKKEVSIPEEGLFDGVKDVSQNTVIEADASERILVNAGPGTGKTWTLIEKIVYMVKNLEIEAETIQVLCFSRAAVEVIRKRIDQEIERDNDNLDIKRIDVRTFDSFATQLLYWVRESDYDLIPENYQLESLNYDERIQKFIEVVKAEPDLVSECKHLVVDEVQDLVLTRAEMVLTLIKSLPDECGVTLLGDACQAIYDYQLGDGTKSLEFYREVKKFGTFSFYSFSENHRQTSELMAYSDGYRKHILDEDIEGCQDYLESLTDLIPACKIKNLEQINKAVMDFYFDEGSIAILTRNNAQALSLSGALREHGVEHCMQRRLNDLSLCSWIALVLNNLGKKTYSYTEFADALEEVNAEGIDEIWDFVSDGSPDRRIDTKAILTKIKEAGTCRYLYVNAKQSRLTVSTIHRSKGREYDSVIILDELLQDETKDLEEHRVKYVALSRARSSVFRSSMKKLFFRTLEDRRCFSVGTVFKNNNKYLKNFEVGLKDDLNVDYFASADALQEWIRENADELVGKEVYLSRQEQIVDGCVIYDVVLEEDNTIVGQTSRDFSWDLSQAIRQIKGLSNRVELYDYLYPAEFHGIYITDIASEIALMRGNEQGIEDFGGLATWNTLQIEGYAKASY